MTNPGEIWRAISGFEGLYEASSLGRVRSLDRVIVQASKWGTEMRFPKRGKVLTPRPDGSGYPVLQLRRDNRSHAINVHRLIAIAFLGERKGMHVNHINGIKSDNRIENLEWCTRSENMQHARRIGLVTDHKPVIGTPKNGGDPITFPSIAEAARQLGGSTGNIQSAAKGRAPSAYGYRWKYAA